MLTPHKANESTDAARASLDDCYAQIISDCKAAIDLLPEKRTYSGADYNRASMANAASLLARL